MRIHSTSGRAIASTSPGRPAPEPMSPTRPVNSGAITALFSTWRVHSRGWFEWADQSTLFAVLAQRGGEPPRQVDAVAEDLCGDRRLGLNFDHHRCFT